MFYWGLFWYHHWSLQRRYIGLKKSMKFKNNTITLDKYNWCNALDYMDLFIYKGDAFCSYGKLSISFHQKETNKFMYIPNRSYHQRHLIKNYVWGELKRYVQYRTDGRYKYLALQIFSFQILKNQRRKSIDVVWFYQVSCKRWKLT